MKSIPLSLLAGVIAASAAQPQTLLDMTHAARPAPSLRQAVVVVIDAQREYTEGRLPLFGVDTALRQTARLLARARAASVPVIHIQQVSTPGRPVFDPSGPFVAFAPEAMPLPSELVVTKRLPNAFAGTTLDQELRKLGRTEIIFSGYMTHMCISATARSALDHGYHATVIADACATRDLPAPDGGIVPALEVHRVALAELADRFATVVPTLDAIPD